MKMYSAHGIQDFIICCGYKGYMIKEYFANYLLHMSDITFDMPANTMHVHKNRVDPWTVTLVDTGEFSMTGGRLARVAEYLKNEPYFCFTYGDGVGDVDIRAAIEFHHRHGKLATLTSAYPPGRFGALDIKDKHIRSFKEKPKGDGAVVNAGFFVLSPAVFDYIEGDHTVWEQDPLSKLAEEGQLMAFEHAGFWQPMDTMRDKTLLEELWAAGKAPWKTWE
jgi:glucose-1-phosphate cytidylyltransferase